MSTPITEYVSVTITVADRLIQTQGFGVPLLYDEFSLPGSWITGQRTQNYTSLSGVAVDFAVTTKIYRMAAATFTGDRAPATIKVGRGDSGDANLTAALDAIEAESIEWYCLVAAYLLEADVNEIAAWVLAATVNHIYGTASELSDIITSAIDDLFSDLEGFANNRTFGLYHHNGGVDVTGAAYTVVSGIVTVTETAHGLLIGDTVVFSNSSGTSIDGVNVVATVPTSSTFTCTTTAADGGPLTVDYFARYDFPECRWVGRQLPTEPGEEDWAFKELKGQEVTPEALLTLTQQQFAKGKNGSVYTSIGGIGATQIGTMATGRFIDTQIGIDWMDARFGEAIMQRRLNSPNIPFTQAGINSLLPDIIGVIRTAEENTLLGIIANSTSGETYRITMPQIRDVSSADKVTRTLPAIEITVQLRGSIINFTLNVAALV